jgi:molecular chaperone GrpE
MSDIFGSNHQDQPGHNGKGEESEDRRSSDSGSAGSGGYGSDADVIDGELLDGMVEDPTEIISGSSPEVGDLEEALTQRDEYLDALRRLQAEFANYKKRVEKQQSDNVARAALSLVEKVLPVLDTLDLATSHIDDPESADGRALLAVSGQLRDLLAREGLERLDPLGEEFDPTAQEAVGHLPDEDGTAEVGGSGEVVAQVMRAGYRWRGTVVRPAMVMVRG